MADGIKQYTPGPRVCPPDVWPIIADEVRTTVLGLNLSKRDTLWHWSADVTRYAAWCHRHGHPLPLEFREDLIAAFCDTLPHAAASVQRHRTRLRRLGVERGTIEPKARTRFPHHTATGQAPYTPEEIAQWWQVAVTQATDHRRRMLQATIALGAGAGLRTAELVNLPVSAIIEHPDFPGLWLIQLPDRTVPIDDEWVEAILTLKAETPGEYWFGKPRQQTKDLLTYVKSKAYIPEDLPNLEVRRLRTTYAVKMLNRRLSVSEFLAIFGGSSAITFERLARYIDARWDNAEYLRIAAGMA